MPRDDNWQNEALADAARFAARQRESRTNPPAPQWQPDLPSSDQAETPDDVVLEGERCSECGWALQGGTTYCGNCGEICFEDDSVDEGAEQVAVEDTGVPTAQITDTGKCSGCGWTLQDEAHFCGGCGSRVRADEPLELITESEPGNGSLFGWLRRKR